MMGTLELSPFSMFQIDASKDDASSSSYDSDECLADLLGGISLDGNLNWQEEEEEEHETTTTRNKNQTLNHGRVDLELLQKQRQEQRNQQHQLDAKHAASLALRLGDSSSNQSVDDRFRNAHGPMQEGDGSWSRPKVAICDMASIQQQQNNDDASAQIIEDRGKGLVATDFIPKGSVIFTEKAAIATQIPILMDDDDDESQSTTTKPMVLACQSCFRSMEPLSKLSSDLPCSELWAVLPLKWNEQDSFSTYRSDRYGRIQCNECQALFCCKSCYDREQSEMNGCCTFYKLLGLSQVDSDKKASSKNPANELGLDQAPVVLAAKLFCHAAQYHRQLSSELPPSQRIQDHFLWGLCGDASDLDALEIGVPQSRVTTNGNPTESSSYTSYSLDPLYQHLTKSLKLTEEEQETLSLSFLHMLASKTARNGFGIRTQSPFKPYYSGLLRKFGRDSPAHKTHMEQVAMAISGTSHLERGMDRLIENKVAPWISGIFSLTAHLNHSCEPNAFVVSQEFVDAHIDLVAKRDILAGEEILISYIQGVDQKSTNQRRRELQAKYLFTCGCNKCKYSK